jgi:hypothetical protein
MNMLTVLSMVFAMFLSALATPVIAESTISNAVPASAAQSGRAPLKAEAPKSGILTGRLLQKNGEPLRDGKVHFFREGSGPVPSQILYWRTPDEIAAIGDDGRFTIKLSEGRYYISAIKKMSKDVIGPPVRGDLVYPESRKELAKDLQTFPVRSGETTDIGSIAEVVPFKKHVGEATDVITSIEGKIVNPAGKPVPGAIVFAFASKNLVGKPLYVSERTDSDGSYVLKVAKGGDYFLKSRTSLSGGKPNLGELSGFYGSGSPKPVTVKTGEKVEGILIATKPLTNTEMQLGNPDVPARKLDGFGSGPGPGAGERGEQSK